MAPVIWQRRRWLQGAVAVIVAPVAGALAVRAGAGEGADEPIVKLVARRFRYEPNRISLKAGESTLLEFTSLDFVHGFKIPDLNIRADLPPGRVTKVR